MTSVIPEATAASPVLTEQRPTADLPTPCPVSWCSQTGAHTAHMSTPVALPSPAAEGRVYKSHPADAYIADVDGDGDVVLAADIGGEDAEFTSAESFRSRVVGPAQAWVNGLRVLAAQYETVTVPPVSARPWTMTFAGGGHAEGRGYSWCGDCRTGAHDKRDASPGQARLALADLDHTALFPGVKIPNVHSPGPVEDGGGVWDEEMFWGYLTCRPHDEDPAKRLPLVDLGVTEGQGIDGLGPAELADVAAKLRAQADRLDDVHARLVAARAEWEAQQ